jgi:membrane-associated protein
VTSVVTLLLLGMRWMNPDWLLHQVGGSLFWVALAMVFVECGLFFPFLPGDTLLFATGLFIATGDISVVTGHHVTGLLVALVLFAVAAFLGNVVGFEVGRAVGPQLYRRDGRILKRRYFDNTRAFFDRHGHQALVIGRFVPFVRTFVTVVAGVTRMERRRFLAWSAVGAVAWVLSVTLLGYLLGTTVPGLKQNIDYAVVAIVAFSLVPAVVQWWRHRRSIAS